MDLLIIPFPLSNRLRLPQSSQLKLNKLRWKSLLLKLKEEEIIIEAVESAIIETTTSTETSVEIAETVLEPVIETATTDTNLMQTALNTVIESVLMQVIESKHGRNFRY